ncbi:MAG: response regulator [Spirochaetia bacterium]|jgi:PAS domain S-box-containing protein
MRPASSPLQAQKDLLAGLLESLLRKSAFDNRYSMHPRRLAALAAEQAESYIRAAAGGLGAAAGGLGAAAGGLGAAAGGLGAAGRESALAEGAGLAQEGLGEKTILGISAALRGFSRDLIHAEVQVIGDLAATTEEYTSALLEGFIAAREALLLKEQEQLRRALSTALENQSHELLVRNRALDTSINGILLADLEGKVTWVNSSFLSLWGFAAPADVIERQVTDFWSPLDARQILADLPRSGGWRGEFVAERRDGQSFSVELSASLVRADTGEANGIMSSFVDITERKRLQAQVLQAQKMDALGQLAGGITHDFNNLLTVVSGYLQMLLLDVPRDTQMHQDLIQMKAAVDRGVGLTRQLRLFTRQASGIRQSVSLNEVARETWEIFKRTFPPEITVQLALAPSLWMIEADSNQMSQVLVNLCVNARDALIDPAAGRERLLTVETANVVLAEERIGRYLTARPGKYVLLRVRDSGTGMSTDLLDRLFVPFVTTKSARSGTGLGLAVVYGIVTSHHGFIDVQSTVGSGTAFEILFPMTATPQEARRDEAAAPPLTRGHGKILVVDDDQQVRDLISRVLGTCGYVAVTAADGNEALSLFGTGDGFDLVILDMMMPGMGGRECLARLRSQQPGVRVLVTTGYTSDGSAQELLKEGALGIIEKPLDLAPFAQKVQETMGDAFGGC